MYNYARNNYHQKPKPSNIQTPKEVSQFIFELLKDKFPEESLIFDPCCGKGSLLRPWEQFAYPTFRIDIDPIVHWTTHGQPRKQTDFLLVKKSELAESFIPALILCNPPFNGYGNKLGSEVWLDKIIELFGKEVPIVLFAPVGFRVNLTLESSRWQKFKEGKYPPIASIITLPKNIFPRVVFHSEILIFNIKGLKGHYFYQPNERTK